MATLMRLPEDQREVLVLVAIEGLAYKDAAEILDLPLGTLMSRLARAREALRRALAQGDDAGRERPGLRVVR
jgi:RNA polymerase sigma-70 factor (ECF subfamily)